MVPTPSNRRLSVTGWPMCSMSTSRAGRRGRRRAGAGSEPEEPAQRRDDRTPAVDPVEPRRPARSGRPAVPSGWCVSIWCCVGLVFAGSAVLRVRVRSRWLRRKARWRQSRRTPSTSPAAASTSSSPRPRIVVHVLGAVRRPGLVRLQQGSRVQDAIDAAGGLRSSAAPGELNLAQVLTDGQQIVIGSRGHPGGRLSDGGGALGR